ncbi:Gfo/Idh/MocA family oxidoreductase [Gemmata sp. G18]|uniref:Gfo/Idh/MocA family oxidoreductase n=1 Tax=Gemmata palustris TaxID=2822762 RepID=A0ABS5C4X7_9BACT|nr:Gfo/Idh/MocA family oxidoreductase [Gemmata palustris]MBP3961043.1 Gfo/Idh/MocA family oxidoreductase [Gemmata palustris]
MNSRRTFLKSSASGAAALTCANGAAFSAALPGPDKLTVALIGCGGMGTNHLTLLAKHKQLNIAYVCDVDDTRLRAAAKIATSAGHAVKAERDMRVVLADKAVGAVWMATPDHWHAPGAVLAADAGKHVYVEKPCSHNVREGRLLVDAAQRNKVHIQVGTQSRSTPTCAEAVKRLRDGAIGEVLVAKAWNSQLRRTLGKVKPSEPPKHLDYEAWQGPVPEAPFYANRVHSSWRFFRDYGAGDIGNDGVHDIDVGVWGMKFDALPNRVAALGGKFFFDDDQEWPDTQYVVCEYDAGNGGKKPRQFIFEQRIWSPYVQEDYENGCAFYGTKGLLIIGHGVGWKLFGERNKPLEEMKGRADLSAHHQNFIDACLKGEKLTAPAAVGHISAGICHLANISTRLRKTVELDPVKEVVTNSPDANALLRRAYRPNHWAVPKGV